MSLEDIWKSGLERYSQGEWGQTIDLMEEALRLFNDYENQTYTCLQNCRHMPAKCFNSNTSIIKD